MRWSDERILTTHTGSLPRPPELTRLYVRRARGGEVDPAEIDRLGKEALRQIVDKQVEPFLTAPSPGIIAAAMKNEYYDSEEAYLAALGKALRIEYEAVVNSGFLLQ